MNSGYLLLYRQIFENPFWAHASHERSRFEALIWILSKAAYEDHIHRTKAGPVHLRKGEVLLSIGLLQDVFHWTSRQKARGFLERLQKDGTIVKARDAGNAGTVYFLPKFEEAQKGRSGRMPSDTPPAPAPPLGPPKNTPVGTPCPSSGAGPPGGLAHPPSAAETDLTAPEEGTEANEEPNHDPPMVPPGGEAGPGLDREASRDREEHPAGHRRLQGADTRGRYPKRTSQSMTYPEAFGAWWAAYPRRIGTNPMRGAYRMWRNLVHRGVSEEELLRAAEGYAASIRRRRKENTSFVMKASNFLGPDAPWEQYVRQETETPPHGERVIYPWEAEDQNPNHTQATGDDR